MNATVEDLRSTTLPKSTQLNADQLIVGPMDLTITEVRIGAAADLVLALMAAAFAVAVVIGWLA